MAFVLAVAVLLDATIVRSVLVPAAMQLLGDRNWYLPPVLRWLPELRTDTAGRAGGAVRGPAAMQRRGDRNWYLPPVLRWLPEIRTDTADRAATSAEAS